MCRSVVVVGTQFGDEGKGKIVDYLSPQFDYVVRYQGGDNAGHSIFFNQEKYILRLVPSGIFQTKAIITQGVVLNPENLIEEIRTLEKHVQVKERLFISKNAHIIFDFHIQYDKLLEKIRGLDGIGTTNRGIGPCYSDKALRLGIRAEDLLSFDKLHEKIKLNLLSKNELFKKYNLPLFDPYIEAKKYFEYGQILKIYLIDTFTFMQKEIENNKKFLFEGSQGLLLDIDCGTYPFVTSSNIISALSHGTCLPFSKFKKIIGIVKAYSTRVGNGQFVTELQDEELKRYIQEKGNEYGSVTKRPRRIGWLDLVAIKYSIIFSGITHIALTLVDVLSSLEELKICVGYRNSKGEDLPIHLPSINDEIFPIYKTFKGWQDDYFKIKSYSDFSKEFKDYLTFLEAFLNVPVLFISIGKGRDQIIVK